MKSACVAWLELNYRSCCVRPKITAPVPCSGTLLSFAGWSINQEELFWLLHPGHSQLLCVGNAGSVTTHSAQRGFHLFHTCTDLPIIYPIQWRSEGFLSFCAVENAVSFCCVGSIIIETQVVVLKLSFHQKLILLLVFPSIPITFPYSVLFTLICCLSYLLNVNHISIFL